MSVTPATPLGAPGLLAAMYGGTPSATIGYQIISSTFSMGTSNFGAEPWSMKVTGYVYAPSADLYTFYVTADDGVKLSISNTVLFSDLDGTATGPATRTQSGDISLSTGWYAVELFYTDFTGAAAVTLEWSSGDGSIPKQAVPAAYLRAGTGPVTIGAWIKPDTVAGFQTVVAQDLPDGSVGIALGIKDGGVSAAFKVMQYTDNAAPNAKYRELNSVKSEVVAGKWQHIAVAYDGTTMNLFVDGIKTDTKTYSAATFTEASMEPVIVGNEGGSHVYTGEVYNVAMYNAAKTDMASVIKCTAKTSAEPDLMLYLALNEGVSTTAYELAGSYFGNGVITAPTWTDKACEASAPSPTTTPPCLRGLTAQKAPGPSDTPPHRPDWAANAPVTSRAAPWPSSGGGGHPPEPSCGGGVRQPLARKSTSHASRAECQ